MSLQNGSQGSSVKKLQTRLNQLGFNCGATDGIFGPKTLSAVRAFQKSRGLAVDGIVGPKTKAKLWTPAYAGKWTHIIWHHTGAEEKNTAQIRNYHVNTLGWRDIGYNYVIERDGRIVPGRSLSIAGAHCKAQGMNSKGIGIAVIGNLNNHAPLAAQRSALVDLSATLSKRFNIPVKNMLGHREVTATACPGGFMDPKQLRADVQRKLSPSKPTPTPAPKPAAGGHKVGQRVRVKKTANRYATGERIADFVKGSCYTIRQLKPDRALLKEITSWVKLTDIEPVSGSAPAPAATLRVGSRVRITGSRYATGQSIPGWVKNQTHTVAQVKSDRVLLGYPRGICSWVLKKNVRVI